MTLTIHTIHHFEDEPELVRWIPGVLFNRFWSRFPQWVVEEGRYEEHNDGRTTFELQVDGDVHVVEYRLYTDYSSFETGFAAKPHDVALIDVMDKGNRPLGLTVYADVVRKLDAASVFFLTSFPAEVSIPVSEGHVLPKPVDVTELADRLIKALQIGGSQ